MIKHIKLVYILLFVLFFSSCALPPMEPVPDDISPNIKPPVVEASSIKAESGKSNITISWNAVDGASGYVIMYCPASEYGTPFDGGGISEDLESKGFRRLPDGTITATSYTISKMDISKEESYLFSILTQKNMGEKVVYSAPSVLFEASVAGNVSLDAVSTSSAIIVNYYIPNIYSVLNEGEFLYKPHIKLSLWKTGDDGNKKIVDDIELGKFTLDLSHSKYEIESDCIYNLQIELLGESDTVLSRSDIYSVSTDSTLLPDPVEKIEASQGTVNGCVDISFTASDIPKSETEKGFKQLYIIERSLDGNVFEEIERIYSADVTDNGDGTHSYTYSDKSVDKNTYYYYRVINAVESENGSVYKQEYIDKSEKAKGYPLWIAENPEVSVLDSTNFENTEIAKSRTLEFSFDYDVDIPDGLVFKLEENVWKTGSLEEQNSEIILDEYDKNGEKVVFSHEISIEYQTEYSTYSYTLILVYKDEIIAEIPVAYNGGDQKIITLGENTIGEIIVEDSFSASTDQVGVIVLSWKLNSELASFGQYTEEYLISQDGVALEIAQEKIIKGDDGSRSYLIETEGEHSYRLGVIITIDEEKGSYSEYYDMEVDGMTLSSPSDFIASDGSATDKVTLTWTKDESENVSYDLSYKIEGSEEEIIIEGIDSPHNLTVDEADRGKTISFSLKAYNKIQSSSEKIYTEEVSDEGYSFGTAVMNLKASDGEYPDKITLSWNPVKGATSYRIFSVYSEGDTPIARVDGTVSSYDDSSMLKRAEEGTSSYSDDFKYKIVAYRETDGIDLDAPAVETSGRLFAPPKNIVASKGERTYTTISWDPVPEADSYEISAYTVNRATDEKEYIFKDVKVNGTSYDYGVENTGVYFTVRSVKGSMVSEYQNLFGDPVENKFGESEDKNYGYPLNKVANLIVRNAVDENGYLKDYAIISWQRIDGATSYRIKANVDDPKAQSDSPTIEIKVDSLKYDPEEIVTNGKHADEIGYLSYDPSTKTYTYNDASGTFRTDYYVDYSISAVHSFDNDTYSETRDVTALSRVSRAPRSEEIVNLVSNALKYVLSLADSEFGGDWAQYQILGNNLTYSYGDMVTITMERSNGHLRDINGNLNINNTYSGAGVPLVVSSGGALTVHTNSSYASGGPLYSLDGTLNVKLDNLPGGEKFKDVSITYSGPIKISPDNIGTDDSYSVVYGERTETVKDTSSISRVM